MNPFLNSMMHFNHPLLTAEATAAAAAAAVASLIQPNDSSTSAAEMEQASQLLLNLNNHFEIDHHHNHLHHQQQQKCIKNDAIITSTSISNVLNDNKNTFSKQIETSSLESTNSNKTAEVMCNLCTKLFYTEEFLAMHKLNKHGVPLNSNDTLMQSKSSTSNKEFNNFSSSSTTSASASNDKLMNIRNSILKSIKNEPQQHSLNNDKENLDDIITKNRNNILVNALYAKDILSDAKTTSDLVEIDRTKFNFLASETNNSINSMNESYCEFCNKSFCNKYFLKTHMLRSHGKFLNSSNNKPDFDLEDNEYLISQSQSLDAHQQQHHQQSQQEQQQNKMKQFNSEDSDNEFNENNNTSSKFINGVIDSNFAAKIADRVVCDICNKDVCNKYFLRTHKQKVHGIQMSDTNSKVNGFFEDQNSCSSGETSLKMDYSLNSSLKIEVNEQQHDNNENLLMNKLRKISNSTSTNSISPHQQQQQQQQPVLQTSSQQLISRDSYCELCKRQFCSKYFLRNHMINMHGINQSKFNYNKTPNKIVPLTPPSQTIPTVQLKENEINKKTKLNEQINSPMSSVSSSNNNNVNTTNSSTIPINGNTGSYNLASRVTCIICNKDLCNKYFLRQHLINVHKTSIEEYNEKFDSKNRNENEESLTINDYATNNQMSPDNDVGEIESSVEDESKLKHEKIKNNHLKFLSLVSESNKSLKRRKRQYSENSSVSSASSNSVFSKYSLDSSLSNASIVSGKLYDKKNKINSKALEKIDKKKIISLDTITTRTKNDEISDVDMQQFLLESSDDVFCSNFMPCTVYLPVKYKLNESVNINLTLKPIKKNKKRTYHENDDDVDNTDKSRELGEIRISDKKFKRKFMTLNDNTNEQKIEIM